MLKKRILIIGSSGMLGVDLSQGLYHEYEIFGADIIRRSSFAIRGFYKLDITKKQNVLAVIVPLRPDIVIHAAAMTDVDGCESDHKKAYKINSDGTKNIAYACKAIGATLIYLSTDFVFNGRRKSPYKETDKAGPLNTYADSKLKGEMRVKRILKKYFILRTGWLYGKHGKNFVDTILKISKKERVLKVVDDQVGSPTYTKDLVKAIHALIRTAAKPQNRRAAGYGIYHISNSGSVSWYNYAKEILRLAKSQTEVVPVSSKELDRPARRPRMSVLDNSKFVKFTGYKMRNWQEALEEYV
ncbi:MAG: dTDP-4-dehydrorhamnose reductase [Candidatus Omnitrophota bacterium]|jgi:dTDP-4-dehydrorhamnose reductase